MCDVLQGLLYLLRSNVPKIIKKKERKKERKKKEGKKRKERKKKITL